MKNSKWVVVALKVKDLKAGDRSLDLYFNNIKSTLLRSKSAAAAETYLNSVAEKVKAWTPADSTADSAAVAANKIEIAKAVSTIFNVKVAGVNTINVEGKKKRMGRFVGKRSDYKKAIVKLAAGETIEFFEA